MTAEMRAGTRRASWRVGLVAAALAASGVAGASGCFRYRSTEVGEAFKGDGEAAKPKPALPPPDARTFAADELGYRLHLPAGWTFGGTDEVVADALGGRTARRRLEAREEGGAPETRAGLIVIVRDGYLDGEDLVRRDLEPWLRELADTHRDVSAPAARAMPDAAAGGVVFGLTALDTAGKAWSYDRGYVFAVATARSYVVTLRMPADRRSKFSAALDTILEGLELLEPPEENPKDAAGCVREAAGLLAEGRLAKAAHCYALLLDARAGEVGALRFGLGTAFERMGLNAEALDQFRRAAEESKPLGDRARARLAEGLLLRRAERWPEAIVAYEKGLEVAPDDRGLLLNLGLAQHLAGEPGRAAGTYERILAKAPDDVAAHENRAAALRDAGRLEEAKAALETAIGLRRKAVAAGGDGAVDAARWLEKDEEALRKVKEKLKR